MDGPVRIRTDGHRNVCGRQDLEDRRGSKRAGRSTFAILQSALPGFTGEGADSLAALPGSEQRI